MASDHHVEKREQEVFFAPGRGWQPNADEGTEYKLESVYTSTTNFLVENRMLKRNPRGGWDTLMDNEAAQLPANLRGHVYRVRRVFIDAAEFVSVKSMRFIDDETAQVLQGMTVLGPDAKPVSELRLLRQEFLLPSSEEADFAERVGVIGGEVTRGRSNLQQMYERIKRLGEVFRISKQAIVETEQIIKDISESVTIDTPRIDHAGEVVTNAYRESRRLLEQTRADAELIASEPGAVEDKGKAASYKEYAEQVCDKIEQLHRLQRSYEAQVATRLGEVFSDKLPIVDMPETSRKLLFAPVVEYYLQRGFNCTLTDKGLVLRVRDYVITLGDQVAIKPPGSEEATEQGGSREPQRRGLREI